MRNGTLLAAGQFGCNAMVMLQGEEEPQDAQLNQEMTNFVLKRGEMGGGDAASSSSRPQTQSCGGRD